MWRRLLNYLSEKEAWIVLATLLGLILFIYAIIFVFLLPFLTRHKEEYVLPSLIGRNHEHVRRSLERAGFHPVIIDSQYVPDRLPMTILLQDPSPNTPIKKGRRIYLTVASSTPPQVPLPRVEGLPYEQAYRLLRESYGFQIAEVKYVTGDVPDIVVEVLHEGKPVKAGQLVPKYSSLSLVVSRGLSEQKVPFVSVVGMPLEEAIARINAMGLSVGYIRYKAAPHVPTGYVYRQYPEKVPGDSLPMGMAIDLFVNGEQPESQVE
ncbi:MAG: PASTA domain-containing protein [Bacteroidia bacterium]|nr:PASTA domain-containing protein [Bacteroidia bacterium]MDW8133436.1 PASTA domain-containing protein [Bacteroidia bacterium]